MPQTEYFIPYAAPGTMPAAWDGMDGFAATNIVAVMTNFTALPGAHELKVSLQKYVCWTLTMGFQIWMVEPAVIIEKIVIGE